MQSFQISAEFVCLQYRPLARPTRNVAVLLLDRNGDTLLARFANDFNGLGDTDLKRMSALAVDVAAKSQVMGEEVCINIP